MKAKFNAYEKVILRMLYNYRIPMTIYETAKIMGISYPTCKKYMIILCELNFLIEEQKKPHRYVYNYKFGKLWKWDRFRLSKDKLKKSKPYTLEIHTTHHSQELKKFDIEKIVLNGTPIFDIKNNL